MKNVLPSREMNGQPSRDGPLKSGCVPEIDSTGTAADHAPYELTPARAWLSNRLDGATRVPVVVHGGNCRTVEHAHKAPPERGVESIRRSPYL